MLQVVNLAVKIYPTKPAQTKLIYQYVFNLAKYIFNLAQFDQNYDKRDRARFIRAILFPQGEPDKISKHVKKIFLAPKPPPQSKSANRYEYQLGSLSHFINTRAGGYQDLSGFPQDAPDHSVRIVEVPKLADNPWKEEDIQRNEAGKLRPGPSGQTRAWPQLCTGQQQQPPGQTLRQNPAAVMKSQSQNQSRLWRLLLGQNQDKLHHNQV